MATLDELELRLRALEQAQAAEPTSYYTSMFSGEEMDQRLAAAGVLGAASTPQAALAALGAAGRPNLLDNAYFVGGGTGWGVFPVNQRGQTSYANSSGAPTQTIDRWYIRDGSEIRLLDTGVNVSLQSGGRFAQINRDLVAGEVYTVSVLIGSIESGGPINVYVQENGGDYLSPINSLISQDGLFSQTFVCPKTESYLIIFTNSSQSTLAFDLTAVKIELGDTQTLAYQKSDGTWAILPQNLDYHTELAKCQAYQIELNPYKSQNPTVGTVTRGPGNWYCAIALPATMRTIPTLKIDRGTPTVECPDGTFPVSQLTLLSATSGMAFFVLTFSGSTPSAASSGILYIAGTDSGADAPSVLLDANL